MVFRNASHLATLCIALLAVLIGYRSYSERTARSSGVPSAPNTSDCSMRLKRPRPNIKNLEVRVKKLQSDPDTIVKEAREKLGFVMPGEVVLVQPQPKPDVRTASAVAENVPARVRQKVASVPCVLPEFSFTSFARSWRPQVRHFAK